MFRIIWGIVLIGVGAWFLGQNLGWTNIEIGAFIAAYWPVVLIVLGLSVLAESLKSAILQIIILIIVAAIFVLPFVFDQPAQNGETSSGKKQGIEILSQEAKKLELEIKAGAVDFQLNDQTAANQAVVANLLSDFLLLTKSERKDGDKIITEFNLKNKRALWRRFPGKLNNLTISINPELLAELEIDLGAATMKADLSKNKIERFDLDSGAATVDLKLGDRVNRSQVEINGGAATINLEIPRSVGAQLEINGALSSRELDDFNQVERDLYQTENYGSASKKMIIKASLGAASLNIERY